MKSRVSSLNRSTKLTNLDLDWLGWGDLNYEIWSENRNITTNSRGGGGGIMRVSWIIIAQQIE